MERALFKGAVYMIFMNGANEILLSRRFNTGFMDGWYSLPSGHIDAGENASSAAIRESLEEVGVIIHDMYHAHTLVRSAPIPYIDLFFVVTSWEGKFTLMEKDKCDDLVFFPLHSTPDNIIPYVKHVLDRITASKECTRDFSEFGW